MERRKASVQPKSRNNIYVNELGGPETTKNQRKVPLYKEPFESKLSHRKSSLEKYFDTVPHESVSKN